MEGVDVEYKFTVPNQEFPLNLILLAESIYHSNNNITVCCTSIIKCAIKLHTTVRHAVFTVRIPVDTTEFQTEY